MHQLDDERLAAVRADRRRYHETFRGLVATAQRDGTFADVAPADTITHLVFGMINQLPMWYRPDGPSAPTQIADDVADFVLAALQPIDRLGGKSTARR